MALVSGGEDTFQDVTLPRLGRGGGREGKGARAEGEGGTSGGRGGKARRGKGSASRSLRPAQLHVSTPSTSSSASSASSAPSISPAIASALSPSLSPAQKTMEAFFNGTVPDPHKPDVRQQQEQEQRRRRKRRDVRRDYLNLAIRVVRNAEEAQREQVRSRYFGREGIRPPASTSVSVSGSASGFGSSGFGCASGCACEGGMTATARPSAAIPAIGDEQGNEQGNTEEGNTEERNTEEGNTEEGTLEDKEIKGVVKECVRAHGLRRTHVSFVDGDGSSGGKSSLTGLALRLFRIRSIDFVRFRSIS